MPFDPLSLTGMAMMGQCILRHNRCPVCNEVKLFAKWQRWNCCQAWQCPDCAAATEKSKRCRNCNHPVQ